MIIIFLVFSNFIFTISPSKALEYVRLSGVVQNSYLNSGSNYVTLWQFGQIGRGKLAEVQIQRDGSYSLVLPKNTPVDIAFNIGSYQSLVLRKSSIFAQDSVLNVKIPEPSFKISGRVVDAQGNPLSGAIISLDSDRSIPIDPLQISNDGTFWDSESRTHQVRSDANGNFSLLAYSTKLSRFKRVISVQGRDLGYSWLSPEFVEDGPKEIIACMPVNFGTTLSLPSYCSRDVLWEASSAALEAKRIAELAAAIELKRKREAEAQAEADAKRKDQSISLTTIPNGVITLSTNGIPIRAIATSALPVFAYNSTDETCEFREKVIITKASGRCVIAFSQEGNSEFKPASNLILDFNIAAATKKSTITCVKGKLARKVTAIKPKCPSGYRLKK
jgi:hypothetical protein